MRSETRRKLDRLVWQRRLRVGLAIASGLGLFGALSLCANWPDPVVETRIVSGVVTDWTKSLSEHRNLDAIVIMVSLDDGRKIIIKQRPPDVLFRGPAEIEEQRHESGRISFRWVKPKLD
jgi:hypothetical protein